MSKRRHGEGCWDSISVKGITYKRFRIDGQSFTGKTEKACKAKYLKWKNGQKTNLTDKKTTVKQVAPEWLDSKKNISNHQLKYLSQLFYRETGIHLKQYLTEYIMERGRELLLSTNLSIAAISSQCGFSEPHNFSRSIRHTYGMSPSQLRQNFKQH